MEPDRERFFLKMAVEQPDLLCADAPDEILEACGVEVEPTDFLEQYFAAGHSAWLSVKHGRTINKPQILINQAILVLYRRACLLYTDKLTGTINPESDKPFFSDDDLY